MPSAPSKPAALLVTNPRARRTDRGKADVMAVLRGRFSMDVRATTERDEATRIAAEGASAGIPLVVAFGGDGHVNEVVNGIAGSRSALGIIPGGTMNVFARALGVPNAPIEAAKHLVAAADRPPREVPLGQVDDRYFTFSAGCGFDAETAERVERHLGAKWRFGEAFFYWSALRVLAGSYRRREPVMSLEGDFGDVGVCMAVASNCGAYAYLAGRSVELTPGVTLEGGLGVFSLRRMRLESLPSYAWRVAVRGTLADHRDVFCATDLEAFELRSERPFHRHVDGEPLTPATRASFRMARAALRVQA